MIWTNRFIEQKGIDWLFDYLQYLGYRVMYVSLDGCSWLVGDLMTGWSPWLVAVGWMNFHSRQINARALPDFSVI